MICKGFRYSSGALGVGTTQLSGRVTACDAGNPETRVLIFFPLSFKANSVKLDVKGGTSCRATLWAVENLRRVSTVPGLCIGPGSWQAASVIE